MKLIKKTLKTLLIYGLIENALWGYTSGGVINITTLADIEEARAKGNTSCKSQYDILYVWKQVIKNLKEIKKQMIRYWKAL